MMEWLLPYLVDRGKKLVLSRVILRRYASISGAVRSLIASTEPRDQTSCLQMQGDQCGQTVNSFIAMAMLEDQSHSLDSLNI